MYMVSEKKRKIAECANLVRKSLEMQIPFLSNINEIIKALDGKIEESEIVNFEESELILETKPWEGKFTIRIVPNMKKERASFFIAHELGHLFLHTNYIEILRDEKATVYFKKEYVSREAEFEANEFAANLLMPEEEFRNQLIKNTKNEKVNTKKVAEYFEVSISTASLRGESLGYIKPWYA